MAHRTSPSPLCQVAQVRHQFILDAALPFADILPADQVQQAVHAEQVCFRERLFSPAVTLWMFLSQVLDTSAYCKARGRLPEAVLARLVRQTGQRTHDDMPAGGKQMGESALFRQLHDRL